MKQISFITIIIIFLLSCMPDVRFEEAQPEGKRNLKKFPQTYRGKYLNLNDSSVLTISSREISREWNQFSVIDKDSLFIELDTIFEDDIVLKLSDNWQIEVKLIGDSAEIKSHRMHSVFSISENDKLRKYKGYLFLNYFLAENSWDVEVLKKENDSLRFEKLVYVSDIDTLSEIINMETVTDTVSNKIQEYILKPKRKELRQILKAKKAGRVYIKLD
ncbi:MAG: hypothetical protein ABFS35_04305 [Bacteroidota bacterium]